MHQIIEGFSLEIIAAVTFLSWLCGHKQVKALICIVWVDNTAAEDGTGNHA